MADIQIVDLTPIGHYADGSPRFRFSHGLPSSGVRMVGKVFSTVEEAHAAGVEAVRKYEAADPFGNMGTVCGVAAVPGGYRAVINTYHSNT